MPYLVQDLLELRLDLAVLARAQKLAQLHHRGDGVLWEGDVRADNGHVLQQEPHNLVYAALLECLGAEQRLGHLRLKSHARDGQELKVSNRNLHFVIHDAHGKAQTR